MKYDYELLNCWKDADTLFVNYSVKDLKTNQVANSIEYYKTYDLSCDYYEATTGEIKKSLLELLEKTNGSAFNKPKISEASKLLKYVYDNVCDSDYNMCYVDYDEWDELKEEYDFTDKDIEVLEIEKEKFNLENALTIDDGEYKICGYGVLQTMFNDDREKGSAELER